MKLRHAFRFLTKNPATTAIIVLTLALCIGANTAVFSIVDATLLRSLPYPDPDRLARVVTHYNDGTNSTGQDGRTWESVSRYADLIDAAVYGGTSGVNLAAAGGVRYVKQQRIGAGYFRVFGIPPLVGREFTAEEDRVGGPPLAILSYPLWREVFRQDPAAVGKTLMLRGEPYTVVGVMPESYRSRAEVWTPLRARTGGEGGGINYAVIARLKPGVTWAQADGQLETIGKTVIPPADQARRRLHLIDLHEADSQSVRRPVLIMWAAVALVLLIGCANVGSLLLARAASRSREMATRLALGARRSTIVGQLLVEAMILALIGGTAGVLVGYFGLEGLKALALKSYGQVAGAHLDGRVLFMTALLSLLVSLIAGIFPALDASGVDVRTALTEAGGRGVTGQRRRWSRRLLVGGEIAIAVLLLIGAGLLVRSLASFYGANPGFDGSHVITASVSLQDARYATLQRVNQYFESGLQRMRALPGVEAAGAGLSLPFEAALNTGFQRKDGPEAGDQFLITNFYYVTPGYLEALRVPVLQGRAILDSDSSTSAGIVLVNESFVKKYLSRQNPMGSHLDFGKDLREVVGVVRDVQQSANFGNFAPIAAVPAVYIPASQTSDGFLKMVHVWFQPAWVVRASGPPRDVMQGIQQAATAVDPMVPINAFRTLDGVRAETLSTQRFQAMLLGSLSALALVLAIVGIYGLMSQSVQERRREMGIRIALGATLGQVIREAVVPGIRLAVGGVIAGCILAAMSTKVLQHLIWGVHTSDPSTYLSVAAGLLVIAAGASFIPALRITRLHPAETLREE